MWHSIEFFGLNGVVQIVALWAIYYYILLFFRGTHGAQVLIGLALLLAVTTGLTQVINLDVLSWILRNITLYLAIALVVIFQPEIRRALAELGRHPFLAASAETRNVIETLVTATTMLARSKTGALIAIERDIGTRAIQETGVQMEATLSPELLESVFFPRNPLHDGGVIVNGDRIMAAGCVFPLSDETGLNRALGTRHRAALGLSEATDAVVIVVSEETGSISGCCMGKLTHDIDGEALKRYLSDLLTRKKPSENVWRRMRRHLDFTARGIARSEKLRERERIRAE